MNKQTETPTNPIDFFPYSDTPETKVIARQKWDMLALDTRDGERLNWALQNFFEPFSVTTQPRQSALAGQIEIITTLWFRRPAHSDEKEVDIPWAKETAKKPTIVDPSGKSANA